MEKTNENRKADVRALLEDIQSAKEECSRCQQYMEALQAERERVQACHDQYCGGDAAVRRKETLLAELTEGETVLYDRISAQWKQIRAAEEVIGALPDARQRAVLRLRYVDGLSWAMVQAELGKYGYWYEERQVFRLHRSALKRAQKLLPS